MKVQDNYMDLIEHFKVEELKERLEFDMAAEAAGWGKTEVKAKAGGSLPENAKLKSVEAKHTRDINW
jgi:LDH2 family malate/lactate/ureidoglycolate dehydrogenase